jgi:hypothetical protein
VTAALAAATDSQLARGAAPSRVSRMRDRRIGAAAARFVLPL